MTFGIPITTFVPLPDPAPFLNHHPLDRSHETIDHLPPLGSSLESKQAFVRHGSHQDCTSCHQQYLPMAAIGLAKKRQVPVNSEAENELIKIVRAGELK